MQQLFSFVSISDLYTQSSMKKHPLSNLTKVESQLWLAFELSFLKAFEVSL